MKPVGNGCNLKCDYCFYNELNQTNINLMSYELLEKIISQSLAIFKNVRFVWHGGEPLLSGIDFFKNALLLQNKYNYGNNIDNSVQTNGLLITEEWIDFFKKNNIKIGISIDGCSESHDKNRKYKNKTGSYKKLLKKIKLIQSKEFKTGYIQTLTKANVTNFMKDFSFFVNELNANKYSINLYYNENDPLNSLTNEDAIFYLKNIIDLWIQADNSDLEIREIEQILHGIFQGKTKTCSYNNSCKNYLCIENDGNIYPCDRLSGKKEFYFGNLNRNDLSEILLSENFNNFINRSQIFPDDCKICEWKNYCNNGCMGHRNKTTNLFQFCETRKFCYSYLSDKIKDNLWINR